jgi:hypothetical protein
MFSLGHESGLLIDVPALQEGYISTGESMSVQSRGSVSVFGAFLLASTMLVAMGAVPVVHATGYTVDQSWCTSMGGTWSPNVCIISGTVTINSGDSLDVPSGVALLSSVVNNGMITIEGTLETNSFDNYGTFTQTAGSTEVGEDFSNYGSVSISGSAIITIDVGTTFHNYGSFTDSATFWNDGTFYEGCPPATFDSTPNKGVGTYVPPTGCTITGAPEFPLGLALLFAVTVPALLLLRSIRVRKPAASV